MLEAISHIALVVRDPARTAALFHDLFGADALRREDEDGHFETFVRLAGIWIVLVGASVERARTGDHIAFHTTPEILESTAAKLQALGREFIRARSGRALYFFDYDDHVFELEAEDIDERLGSGKARDCSRAVDQPGALATGIGLPARTQPEWNCAAAADAARADIYPDAHTRQCSRIA